MALEHSLPPNFHLPLFSLFLNKQNKSPRERECVFKSTTSTSYRNLKTEKALNMSSLSLLSFFLSFLLSFFLSPSLRLISLGLVPQSRGSL